MAFAQPLWTGVKPVTLFTSRLSAPQPGYSEIMRTKITSFLPESLKATVRPIYKKLFHGVSAEKSTNLQIKLFGGFEIAYREGTTDEIIIGNRSAYQLSNLLPGYGFNETDVIVNIGAHIGVFALIAS